MNTRTIAALYSVLVNAGLGFWELRTIISQFRGFALYYDKPDTQRAMYSLSIEGVTVVRATNDYNRLSDYIAWVATDIAEANYSDQPLIQWVISPIEVEHQLEIPS